MRFAGEMLNVVTVLVLFAELVLQPAGILPEHCLCLQHMHVVLSILRLQDRAVHHLRQLQEALRAHFDLCVSLYPVCLKPKLHYMWHVAACISKWRANLR